MIQYIYIFFHYIQPIAFGVSFLQSQTPVDDLVLASLLRELVLASLLRELVLAWR